MQITKIDLPNIGEEEKYNEITQEEVQLRYQKVIDKIVEKKLTHLIVYADREHHANLSYITGGYDSRFEETLLIIKRDEIPILIVGNEGFSYSDICLIKHKKELYQTFSLQGQTRNKIVYLSDILKKYKIDKNSRIGIVGHKYYEMGESNDPEYMFDIPYYIIREISKLTQLKNTFNVTDIFTNSETGLRNTIDHHEVARFELMNNYLSNQMKRMIQGLKVGMSETDVFRRFKYKGIPFSTHSIVNFGTKRVLLGLASPSMNVYLKLGDAINIAVGVAGANIARTGLAVYSENDFKDARHKIIKEFYYPYFSAIKTWYEYLRIGESSKKIYNLIKNILGDKKYGVSLNPGHQIHLEEWINSPFRKDYDYKIKSGMALQCDLIAFPGGPFVGIHVEDTVIVADNNLREKIKLEYKNTWKRIEIRRNMMKNLLGIKIGEEILPLSNIQAVLWPFLLNINYAITER